MSVATCAGTSVFEQGPEAVAAQRLAIGSLKGGDLVEFVDPEGLGDTLSILDVCSRGDGCDSQAPVSSAMVRVERSGAGLPAVMDLALVGDDSTSDYEGFVTVGLPSMGIGGQGYGELRRPELVDPQTGRRFYGSRVGIAAVARGGVALGIAELEGSVTPSNIHQRRVDLASELVGRVGSGRLPKSTVAAGIEEFPSSIAATLQTKGGQWIMAQIFSEGGAVKLSAARTRQKPLDPSVPAAINSVHHEGMGLVTATTSKYGLDSLAIQPDRNLTARVLRGLGFSDDEIRTLTNPTIKIRGGETLLSDPADLFAVIAADMRGGRKKLPYGEEGSLLHSVTSAVDVDRGRIALDFRSGHSSEIVHPEAALRRFLEPSPRWRSLQRRTIHRD